MGGKYCTNRFKFWFCYLLAARLGSGPLAHKKKTEKKKKRKKLIYKVTSDSMSVVRNVKDDPRSILKFSGLRTPLYS